MNVPRRCCAKREGDGHRRAGTLWRRGAGAAGWLLPGAALILMPKCPACIALYLAALTGIGIPVAAAAGLRTVLLAGSSLVLLGLVVKTLVRRSRAA